MRNDLKYLKKNIGNIFDKSKKLSKVIKNVDDKVIASAVLQLELNSEAPTVFILPDLGVVENFINNVRVWTEFLNVNMTISEIREIGDVKHYLPENEVKYIKLLHQINKEHKDTRNRMYAMTANACFTPLLPPENLDKTYFELKVGQEVELSVLLNRLVELDYDNEYETSEYCQFSQRGGIIDIFSPLHEYPARIEFWGDEIENIRMYSPETQKTVEKIEKYGFVE
jgi:transcription-repair coupling factor (superfamily II helicase)